MKIYIIIRRFGLVDFGTEHIVQVVATEAKAKNYISKQEDRESLDYEIWIVN